MIKIPYVRHWVGREEIDAVIEVLKSDWLAALGPKTKEFERETARFLRCKHAIAVSCCTGALHLSLLALNIGKGDEVITSDLTFAATPSVISMVGAKPVLCDIKRDAFLIDPRQIRQKITKKTKAIMPVHYAGQPCDMTEILEIAKDNNLAVIEDAAHAFGAEYQGNKIGSMTDATCFSFHPIKPITTAEGGLVATSSEELADKIRLLRLHGLRDYKMYVLGHKYVMNDIQAAIGLVQLKKADYFHCLREKYAKIYLKAFAKGPVKPLKLKDDVKHAWHLFVITTKERDQLRSFLYEHGIGTQIHFTPIHLHPYYAPHYAPRDYPNTEWAYQHMLSLPLFAKMSEKDVHYVIDAIKSFFGGERNA